MAEILPNMEGMTEEERIRLYQEMKEALSKGEDSEHFPEWIKNLLKGYTDRTYDDLLNAGAPEKVGFFPSSKKLYDFNQFQNSEEFKQLGTLSKENRHMEYYPIGERTSKTILNGEI
jgi:hypothetical protein